MQKGIQERRENKDFILHSFILLLLTDHHKINYYYMNKNIPLLASAPSGMSTTILIKRNHNFLSQKNQISPCFFFLETKE